MSDHQTVEHQQLRVTVTDHLNVGYDECIHEEEACWRVYNVTNFLEDHPGGDEVLLAATGKDASDDFEDVGHSTTARALMDEYYVGEFDVSTIPTKVKYSPPKQPYYNQDKTSDFVIRILQFLVPVAILGLAVGVRIYTKSD
ncbi:Cytochrome b5 [Platanthera zijinensis]|uniref:Cytochrome b5 n=1 Tax=Platanthera zijinensis TaxID=2320716 RepID=A0AAP0BUQ2_9ASPA